MREAQLEEEENSGSGRFHQVVFLSLKTFHACYFAPGKDNGGRCIKVKEPFQKRVGLWMIKKERKEKHRKKV